MRISTIRTSMAWAKGYQRMIVRQAPQVDTAVLPSRRENKNASVVTLFSIKSLVVCLAVVTPLDVGAQSASTGALTQVRDTGAS